MSSKKLRTEQFGSLNKEQRERQNPNAIWKSLGELGNALLHKYSVHDPETIRSQYLEQIKHYPLYQEWLDRIETRVRLLSRPVSVIEYGSGPGLLAGKLVRLENVKRYTVVEPDATFREMTKRETKGKAIIVNGTGEKYLKLNSVDIAIATATYHHFDLKRKSIQNIFHNLKPGGELQITDGFIPHYDFDKHEHPSDKVIFTDKTLDYGTEQIFAMPTPDRSAIKDQIKTTFLDILRIEELKVCVDILLRQLKSVGFTDVRDELMKGDNPNVDYNNLGYHFITALKP